MWAFNAFQKVSALALLNLTKNFKSICPLHYILATDLGWPATGRIFQNGKFSFQREDASLTSFHLIDAEYLKTPEL